MNETQSHTENDKCDSLNLHKDPFLSDEPEIKKIKKLLNFKKNQDKEIWLFRAPKGFSFDNVKSFEQIDSLENEKNLFFKISEKNERNKKVKKEFHFIEESSTKRKKKGIYEILINKDNKYQKKQCPISKIYTLQQNVKVPIVKNENK